MDSRPSPFKHKREPPPWINRHEDLKRAALSSLDKDLHQWKHGPAALAKRDPIGNGGMNFSRLDKARSFATKEAAHRYGASPENLNTERSGNFDSRRLGSDSEKKGIERGKMQKSSAQNIHGGDLRDDEKKDPMPVLRSDEGVHHVKNSHGKNSGTVAPYRSSSLGSEKPHLKQTTSSDKSESLRSSRSTSSGLERPSLKHTMPYDNKTSVVLCRSNTERPSSKLAFECDTKSGNSGRKLTEKESLIDMDCKRIIKIRAKTLAGNGSQDVIRSCVKEEKGAIWSSKSVNNEEKHPVCSPPKSFNGSSDELSWKSCSPAKDQKLSPPSSEQISDKKVRETPVTFPHITRRARSGRRRDDCSRSQSSKGVSLDGFGAELEEALLKKQEAEVNSAVQLESEVQKCVVDTEASTSPVSTDTSAELVSRHQESHVQRLTGLEQTNEREEGELEPEDEVVEKHVLEAACHIEVAAGNDAQVGKNLDGCGEIANLEVHGTHEDISTHESIASANKLKSSDVCVSVTNNISAFSDQKEQGQELSRNCGTHGESLYGYKGDIGHSNSQHEVDTPFSATEVNLASPFHAGTGKNLHQSNSAVKVEGLACSQQMRVSLTKVDTIKLSKVRGSSVGNHFNGEIRMENGVLKDSAGYVPEGDELFAHDHKQKKLKVESLQLCLAPPGYTTAPANSGVAAFVDPEQPSTPLSRLTQNLSQFQTEAISDGFTTSLSLSSFVHNPSCSLKFTSIEGQELSCGGSRQITQGQVNAGGMQKENRSVTSLSRDKQKRKAEGPFCPQTFQSGKLQGYKGFSSHTECNKIWDSNQAAPSNAFGTAAQASESRGSLQEDRAQKLLNQAQLQPPVVAKSVGEPPSLAIKVSSERSKEILGESKSLSSNKIGLLEICSEPVAAMAQKLQELPDCFLEGLKGLVRELLGSFVKREEFLGLQQILRSRKELTEETLLRAHPTQLEILVALKTGLQSFVQEGAKTLTYKALIEIFFQTRCRNVDCQQSLPVDGCECKVCSQKKGFCHECMCMVCSKFDSDSNTSRWVGCDHCMHWCHTDCGLRMSHIKSISVSQRSSEIQFQCLSCEHYMELYGFVKGVFENFAASWSAETLAKELDCVRRIFHASEDARGKQLRWKAEEMLKKLENSATSSDVCCSMLQFFTGGAAELDRADHVSPRKAYSEQPNEVLIHSTDDGQGDFATMGSIVARKLSSLVEVYDNKELEGRKAGTVDTQKKGAREGVEQGLHNLIGVKLTDVLMYQARADAAREDAANLRHIIVSKTRRMEEDYSLKCARLRLDEVEGRRRKLFEELQALEKSKHEFETMKSRIESDMKHLTAMSNLQLARST